MSTVVEEFKMNKEHHTTIDHRLDSARTQLIEGNKHHIKTLAELFRLCAKQDLALRGHRESNVSQNRGNFLEILSIIANYDAVIKQKLQDGSKNAVYTSPEIQNKMKLVVDEKI